MKEIAAAVLNDLVFITVPGEGVQQKNIGFDTYSTRQLMKLNYE